MASRILSRVILVITLAVSVAGATSPVLAVPPANEAFQRTWARTDKPVSDLSVSRTWMWGPDAFTPAGKEFYVEAPGQWRTVQYFDKSRMEITDPAADQSSPWFSDLWFFANDILYLSTRHDGPLQGYVAVGAQRIADSLETASAQIEELVVRMTN